MHLPRPLLSLIALAALAPAALGAQQDAGSKLRKSDLVRVLTGTTYSKAEIASMVRRSCLAFVPTARDRSDLRELGATQAIFDQIDLCVRKGNKPDAPTPPPPKPLELRVVDRAASAPSGTVAYLTVTLRRGDAPVRGQRLLLHGATSIPGGARTDPAAVTDADGQAVFAVPAGTRAGRYRLTVAMADGSPFQGNGDITLSTLPAGSSLATITPRSISLGRGSGSSSTITVRLTDPFGNPVTGTQVRLQPSAARGELQAQTRATNDSGTVSFSIPVSALRSGDSLTVSSGERTLGVVSVSATAQVASQLVEAARLAAAGDPGAEDAYERALAVDPSNSDALLGRGYLRSRAGRSDDARADFEAALKYGASKSEALTALGYNAARSGNFADAAEQFRAALEANPRDDAAATGLAYAELWQADPHQASRRTEITDAVVPPDFPSGAATAFRSGLHQLRARDMTGAVNALDAAVDSAPNWADAYYNRALAYEQQGRTSAARSDFQSYLRLRPGADDRAEVVKHMAALGRSPSEAFTRGAIFPGLGQFYTGRPVFGGIVTAGVVGSTVWALKKQKSVEMHLYPGPFGGTDTVFVDVQNRPHLGAGLAIAGGLWVLSALEASLHASNARGGIPLPLPLGGTSGGGTSGAATSGERGRAAPEERAMLKPLVNVRPDGPAYGAAISISFR
jgi:tetratricopeptide (TPR) repeat protein